MLKDSAGRRIAATNAASTLLMTKKQMIQENGKKLLLEIRGARLSSVQFVLDFLILSFDEKGALTTLVWPEISNKGATATFGMSGYQESLCALITMVVEDVEITNDETVVIGFGGEVRMLIPLRTYKGSGDGAIFAAPKRRPFVWNKLQRFRSLGPWNRFPLKCPR